MEERKSRRRLAAGLLLVILLVGIGAVRVVKFLPTAGALDTPANTNISQYYISNAVADTHAHNIVTAVLAEYRGFDTLFETCVMLLSGVAVWTVLSAKEKVEKRTDKEMIAYYRTSIFGSMLMDGAFRIVVPIILIYGMYVLFHGEISLGGGFQAGALLACEDALLAATKGRLYALSPDGTRVLAEMPAPGRARRLIFADGRVLLLDGLSEAIFMLCAGRWRRICEGARGMLLIADNMEERGQD